MSEYVDSLAILLQISALIGNIILGYLALFKTDTKGMLTSGNKHSHSQRTTIEQAADWMIFHPTHGIGIYVVWYTLFLVVPFFVPSEYFLEAFDKILGNLIAIPLPFLPFWIAMESARLYRLRKDMESQNNTSSHDLGDE